jgi:hypothetical protein
VVTDASLDIPNPPFPAPATADLNELYPTHANTLTALDDPTYYDSSAYKLFLRTRIYRSIAGEIPVDGPISGDDILKWVGTSQPKTMRNNISRVNQTKKSLEFLRGLPEPGEEDRHDIRILGFLLECPLTPTPIDQAERDDDADHLTIDEGLQLPIRRVDSMNRRVRSLMPAVAGG